MLPLFSACIKREGGVKDSTDGEGAPARSVTQRPLEPARRPTQRPSVTVLLGRMTGHYVLCLTAALATFARLSGAAGPLVRCEACDTGALLLCKPLPQDCVERVREPGCGCCMTCALGEGQACGVYTARCGSGLTCQHQPEERRPLQALLDGRGVCSSAASKKLDNILTQAQKQGEWRILPGVRWPLGDP